MFCFQNQPERKKEEDPDKILVCDDCCGVVPKGQIF